MEIKKAAHVDLERGKTLNLLLGIVVALSVLFVAFEWRSYAEAIKHEFGLNQADLDDVMEIKDLEEQKPEEPEPVQQPEQQIEASLPDDFKVVDNNQEVAKLTFVSSDEKKDLPPPPPAPVVAAVVEEADEIFEVVEEAPEFPGGMDKFPTYLRDNLNYPEIAQENGIQGRVIVQFVVERDGSAANVTVARGVDPSLDKEAIRVIREMPKWKPGKQRGKAVRTKFTLPVVFRLQQ